jgi:hypothetical protein
MVVGVLAAGQTLVILTAGVDLSCGAVMALGGVVMTKLAAAAGVPAPLAVAAGLGVTTLFGLLNGLLVTFVRLPAFIVTLGTLNVAFAATQLYSDAQTVTDLPPALTRLGETFQVGATPVVYGAAVMLALYAVAAFALRETAAGGTSTPWAAPPRRRASPACTRGACSWASTRWPGCSTAWRRCCSSPAPASATRTPAEREPRHRHRRGPRRHQPVRRTRRGARLARRALIVGVFRNGLTLMGCRRCTRCSSPACS